MTTIDIPAIAASAEKVVETVARVEPMIATMASFIPGAAPVMAMVQPAILMAIPFLERALTDIARGQNTDLMGAMIELLQHLSKGGPNSPTLSPEPSSTITAG